MQSNLDYRSVHRVLLKKKQEVTLQPCCIRLPTMHPDLYTRIQVQNGRLFSHFQTCLL